jgi:tetratricopeptide (TPR) repeat protein
MQRLEVPWEAELVDHINVDVCRAALFVALDIAKNGLSAGQSHHGFTLVVGDGDELMKLDDDKEMEYFCPNDHNPFEKGTLHVTNDAVRKGAFNGDGAAVIDGRTGKIRASGMIVQNLKGGGNEGGGRHKSSKAIANQAKKCFVIKCSEDSKGELVIFYGKQERADYKGVGDQTGGADHAPADVQDTSIAAAPSAPTPEGAVEESAAKMFEKANGCLERGENEEAAELFMRAQKSGEMSKEDKKEAMKKAAEANYEACKMHFDQKNFARALELVEKALKIPKGLDRNKKKVARVLEKMCTQVEAQSALVEPHLSPLLEAQSAFSIDSLFY